MKTLTKKHDAVLVAIGLSLSRSIPTFRALTALMCCLPFHFLNDVAFGNRNPGSGKKCWSSAAETLPWMLRAPPVGLGVKNVEMVCLENEQEIPAWKWEVDEAVEEAIKINYRWGPKAVKREGDKVLGLEVKKVLSVFDANKRFNPDL